MNTFIAFGRTKLECEPIGSADVIRAHELDELFNAIGSPYKATTFFFLLLNKNINIEHKQKHVQSLLYKADGISL